MAVERDEAVVNQELILRAEFIFDRTGAFFDPDSFTSVEILDSDGSTVLETIQPAQINKTATGKYYITTSSSWNTSARKVYDRWNITVDGTSYKLLLWTNILEVSAPSIGIAAYVALVKKKVKAPTIGLIVLEDPADYETFILEAVKEFSKLRPYKRVAKLTGDGNAFFSLPSDWDNDFSWIRELEYPIDQQPPSFIEDKKYKVDQLDTGWVCRFYGEYYPNINQDFYLRYVIPHSITNNSSTISDRYKDAVANLAASISCQAIAEKYGHTAESSLDADVINYRTKGDEFASRSKELKKMFDRMVEPDVNSVVGEVDAQHYWETNRNPLNRDNTSI
jgi:hypothetical protein